MGFPVPFSDWTRAAWNSVAYDVLLDRRSRERGIIDPRGVERLIASHAAGATEGGDRIWSLLNLELWYRTFIDKEGIQSLPVPAAHSRARTTPWSEPWQAADVGAARIAAPGGQS